MAFLAPLFFAALLTFAIPILIHLTQRERKQVVEFPSLMFLEKIPYQSVRRRRIRDWPLLALRLAAILLIVLAFARPFFDRPIVALNPPGPWKAEGQATDVAPFTVIEMHVTKDGKGEGKMSLGVPFTIDPGDHTVDLSNYAAAPVTIRNVQLRRGA